MQAYSSFVIVDSKHGGKNEKVDEKEFNVFKKDNRFTFGATKERYEIKKTSFKKGFYVRKPD
ncbi:MAG: hypothetical protein WC848_01180 [Parcubacteria group bacterium]|jgi:hypothetical protein